MAITFLQAVNGVLKTTNIFTDVSDDITALTGNTNQSTVDAVVRAWNDVVNELLSIGGINIPGNFGEGTLTLVTSQREYDFSSDMSITDLVRMYWPLHDETNGDYIHEYSSRRGLTPYQTMVIDQPQPANWTGTPLAAALNPTNSKLRLDRIPQASDNGNQFKFRYEKEFELTSISDLFTFPDSAVRALYVPVGQWAKLTQNDEDADFKAIKFLPGFARAARMMTRFPPRERW